MATMRLRQGFLAFAALLASALAQAVAVDPAGKITPWEYDGETQGIQVWTRMIPGAPLKDFRGVMQVDQPLAVVVAAVTDIASMPEWFFRMSEARIVDSKSLDDAYVYFVLDGIWPVSARDAVIKANVQQDPGTLVLSMMADAAPARLPPRPGMVRIPRMHSGWKLTPLSPTRTEIELIGNADPGGLIPLWLANAVAVLMPQETLRRLRTQMRAPKYRDPEAIFARDPLLHELRMRIRMPGETVPAAP